MVRRAARVLGAAIALGVAVSPAAAQATMGAEEQAAYAVITRLFDAMRAGDTTAMRSAFDSSASLQSAVVRRDGTPVVQRTAIGDWLAGVAKRPAGTVLDERLRNPIVHVDGTLASVWVEYGFFVGPTFSHCGVDAFTLGKTVAGWRILAVADSRRREGCTGWVA
jgi:hypothetical protein